MIIRVNCAACTTSTLHSPLWFAPLQHDGLYITTCPNGHELRIILRQPLFDVLSEVAIQALTDGYYRDAVASAAASLERFFEYYLRVVHAQHRRPPHVFDAAWKMVSAQSERQLGMFISSYIAENSIVPKLLPKEKVKFRNRVIHGGDIPSREGSLNFVQTVIDIISGYLVDLHERYGDGVLEIEVSHVREKLALASQLAGTATSVVFSTRLVYPSRWFAEEAPAPVEDQIKLRTSSRT